MFLGGVILPNALTCSIFCILFIVLSTMACSFLGNIVLAVVSKAFELFVFGSGVSCDESWLFMLD